MNACITSAQSGHALAQYEIAGQVEPSNVRMASLDNRTERRVSGLYRETATRKQWRGLIDACVGIPEVVLAVTFLKDCGMARTMICQPYERDADYTKRYATVWDVTASNYRRVNLDAIVKLTVETHSVDSQCPDKHHA